MKLRPGRRKVNKEQMKLVRQTAVLLRKHILQLSIIIRARRAVHSAFSNPGYPPVLIYQMGKVGSSSIHRSLKGAKIPNTVLQFHRMTNISARKRKFRQSGIFPLPEHLYIGESVRKALLSHPGFPIKIITAVRDPIALVISGIFQNPYFHGDSIKAADGGLDPLKVVDYLEHKLCESSAFSYIYEWFDEELKAVFDIDVFASPFPVEKGYEMYSNGAIEVLLIRNEDLSEKGPEIISSFLGLSGPIEIQNSNVRSDSEDKDKYQKVMKHIRLNRDLCNEIYSSKFVRHFYSEAMINKFIARWVQE